MRSAPLSSKRSSRRTTFAKLLGPCSNGSRPPAVSRVAIHFDVDTIDSNEILLGLGPERNGLTSAEVRSIIADIDGVVDVVALTIAEFIPRQVMHLQQLLSGFPLIAEP
jgi:arginase